MPRRRALWVSLALLAPLARHARAASISALEAARIERLLQFVRSGSAYTAREGAQFLRAKYAKMGEHVTTAAQFIDQIAARSSTSGQAYLLRYPDGRTVPAAQVLADELRRIDRQR